MGGGPGAQAFLLIRLTSQVLLCLLRHHVGALYSPLRCGLLPRPGLFPGQAASGTQSFPARVSSGWDSWGSGSRSGV